MTRAKDISKIVTDADLSGTLDVTGTVTAGGLTVSGTASINNIIDMTGSTANYIKAATSGGDLRFITNESGTNKQRAIISNNGDISFYEDTGTTPKLFWDASAERLGLGTTSPSRVLHISHPTVGGMKLQATTDNYDAFVEFQTVDNNAFIGLDDSLNLLKINNDAGIGAYNHLVIDTSGNVGIGGTDVGNAGAISLNVGNVGSTNGGLQLWGTTTGTHYVQFGDDSGSSANHYRGFMAYAHNGDSLRFGTASTERMRIDSSGNIGIGTSSPTTTLDVYGNINLRGGYNLTWGGAYGANIPTIIGTNGAGANISFYPAGSTSGESMRIDSSGNLLVNKNSQDAAEKLSLNFDRTSQHGMSINNTSSTAPNPATMIEFRYAGTSNGYIQTNGSSTSYNTSSDHRLKENVTADWDATTRLKQLNPVRFNFIADADTTVDGFLAHEVQSVVPEAITGTHNEVDADGNPVYQGIDQSKLVPLLVKTIQELEARIVALETA